ERAQRSSSRGAAAAPFQDCKPQRDPPHRSGGCFRGPAAAHAAPAPRSAGARRGGLLLAGHPGRVLEERAARPDRGALHATALRSQPNPNRVARNSRAGPLRMEPILNATRSCFGAIAQLRRVDPQSSPSPESLQERLARFIEEMQRDLSAQRVSQQDVQDVTYAIIALADEVALHAGGPVSNYWMGNLLQLRYFGGTTAGEGFFRRLESIRRDPQRWEVLRVYYWALLFGFRGKHRVRGGELELMSLVESLQREVGKPTVDTDLLSPQGVRPTEVLGGAKRHAPLLLASLAAAAAALLI